MKITKVYTRRGDEGMTDLVGGVRISKCHPRLEAYGTVDELSSHLGLLVTMMAADDEDRALLLRIQNDMLKPGFLAESRYLLEQAIDRINLLFPEFVGFVLPGGTPAAAQCHVCRTVCRRAERCIDSLMEIASVGPDIVKYVNRLSDYLFVLAKKINFNAGHDEILWQNVCK